MNNDQININNSKKNSLQRNSLTTANRNKSISNSNMKKLLKTKTRKTIDETITSYPLNSLFCLSKRNKFRLFFIRMVEHIWFERIIIITILISSITMFLYTYSGNICAMKATELLMEECQTLYASDISRDNILDKIFILYNTIFSIEMISKIIAKGLILHKGSYLRDGWNILDCFITIYSILEPFVASIDKTVALRAIRLLRVITQIKDYQGIRRLIASIIISLPTLGNVLLFLGFIYVVFAVLGIQLFSGTYYSRCRKPPYKVERDNRTLYISPPYFDRICSADNSTGYFTCPEGFSCVSFWDLPAYYNLTQFNITINDFVNDERLQYNYKFNYNIPNFDNILNCFVNVFCIMTYQNWAELLTTILDGFSAFGAKLYFISIVTVGGFFIMRLILAAQNEALIKVRREEIDQKMKILKRLSIFDKENIADLCREMDGIGTGELIQNIKQLNISMLDSARSPNGEKKNKFRNSEKELLMEDMQDDIASNGVVTLIPMRNRRESNNPYNNPNSLTKSAEKNLSSIQSSYSDDSASYAGIVSKNRSRSTSKRSQKNSLFSRLSENKRKSNFSNYSNSNANSQSLEDSQSYSGNQNSTSNIRLKSSRRSKKNSRLLNCKELPSYHQHRGILLIENLEFEHSAKSLKNKIDMYKQQNIATDPYFEDFFFSKDDDNNDSKNKNDGTLSISPDRKSLIEGELARRLSGKLAHKGTLDSLGGHLDKFRNFLTGKFDRVKDMAIAKIKYLILEEFSTTPHYIIFNLFVYSITFVNIIYLCMMTYPMTSATANKIEFVNIFCSSVFVLEYIFKLLVLGCRGFFKDPLNVMDFVVVNLGIIEIIVVRITPDVNDNANSSLSSFRALRFIRLLKLFKKGFIQRFVNFIITSLRDLVNYCFLLGFFIFIFSIAGREFFAKKIIMYYKYDSYGYYYPGDIPPRENFDTIFSSILTVFILFIGDNWPNIMYEYAKMYELTSYAFFVVIIIFGNIMLLNLFLSIMISNYNTEFAEDLLKIEEDHGLKKEIQKLEKRVKGYWKKFRDIYEKCVNCCGDDEEESKAAVGNFNRRKAILPGSMMGSGSADTDLLGTGSNLQLKINLEKLKDLIPMIRKSLFIFPKTSKIREVCWKIVTVSKIFEYYLMGNIIISLIILALDNPLLSDPTMKKVLYIFDVITTFAFIIEFILKVIAFGFLFNGKYSYIRHGFNILDFITVCLSVSYIVVNTYSVFNYSNSSGLNNNNSTAQKVFRVVKIMRIVRVFKLIERSRSLQATLSAFYVSLKQMLSIILIGSLFILMFSIVGMTYFRGLFYRCNYSRVPDVFMQQVSNKWECIDYGGEWINPYPNFDNIKASFILFFEMMTTEGWTSYMYAAMDAVGFYQQPVMNNRAPWALFFVIYMIFAYFFLLNLAISILSDNFKKEKTQIENNDFLPIQKEFFNIYKTLYKVKLQKKTAMNDKLSKFLLNILDSIYFDVIITMCILANLAILMMNWPNNDSRTTGFIDLMNTIFGYIFIAEAVLKIYVFRCGYFTSGWNIIDFILVVDNLVNLLLIQILTSVSSFFNSSILRAIRVARILRMIKKAKSLNRIFNLFLNSIPGVVNIAILYFILLYVYSVIGMSLFSFIKYQTIIGKKWNFQDFTNSLIMLIRITSGESWNTIMHECMNARTGTFYCKYLNEMTEEEIISGNKGCGTVWAIPYFMSFVILSSMMFLEFFSVIIASTVNDTYVINLHELKKAQLNKFKRKWTSYDKDCTGFMSVNHFQKFLFDIGFPLGISSMKTSDYMKVIALLDIYTYDDKKYIFFYDVLTELTKYHMIHKQITDEYGEGKLFKNNEETVEEKSQLFESMNNDLRELKQHVKLMILDPYYTNDKYKAKKKDKLQSKSRFSDSEYLRLHYAWAIKKISKFTRLYGHMKSRCMVMMEKEKFNNEAEMLTFSLNYLENVGMLDEMRKKNSNETIDEIEEEQENSQRSDSNSRSDSYSDMSNSKSESSNSQSENSDSSRSSNKEIASAGNAIIANNTPHHLLTNSGVTKQSSPNKHEGLINDFLKLQGKQSTNPVVSVNQPQSQRSQRNVLMNASKSHYSNRPSGNSGCSQINSNITFKKSINDSSYNIVNNPNMISFGGGGNRNSSNKNLPILNTLQQRCSSLSINNESASSGKNAGENLLSIGVREFKKNNTLNTGNIPKQANEMFKKI